MSRLFKIRRAFLRAIVGCSFASLAVQAAPNWDGRIYSTACGPERITENDFLDHAVTYSHLVLGEKHLTAAVQKRQAWVIEEVLARDFIPNQRWHLAWEFLNRSDQPSINQVVAQFLSGNGTAAETVTKLMGSAQYATYAPLFEVLKRAKGNLVATNLSRAEKAPVVQGGIAALDPQLLPPDFMMGADDYFRRFSEAMGMHTTPEKLRNYFAAQCLTDDVIAHTWSQISDQERKFLIVGSFHSDFNDGVTARIRARAPSAPLLTVRFIDAADYSAAELESQWQSLVIDPHYGPVADFVLFVNEPQ